MNKLLIYLFGTSGEYSKLPSIVRTTIAGFHAVTLFFSIICGVLFAKVEILEMKFKELELKTKHYLTTPEQQTQNSQSEEIHLPQL